MSNPLRILQTFDCHLVGPAEMTLFGRARRVRLPLQLARLTTYRPATADLVLTKMARGDEQNLEDIRFLLSEEPISPSELQAAFARARMPDVEEIRQLFVAAQPKVLKLAGATLP